MILEVMLVGGCIYAAGKAYFSKSDKTRSSVKPSGKDASFEDSQSYSYPVVYEPGGLDREQETNHYLKISTAAVGLTLLGSIVLPPLSLVSIPLILYAAIPAFKNAYQAIVHDHTLKNAGIVDSVTIIGTLATGYFIVGAFANWLYFLGQKLLVQTESKSQKQLAGMFEQQPRSVFIMTEDQAVIEIPFEKLEVGDIVVVYAGEMIPIDGRVHEGKALVAQYMISGESGPSSKEQGDDVFASTVVVSGKLQIKVVQRGQDTVAAQIEEILGRTNDYLNSVESQGLDVANKMSLPIMGLSSLAWMTLGFGSAVAVFYCDFSKIIRIASPIGVMNFLMLASQQGILIKDGRSLEQLSTIDMVIFDKTGTLTLEEPVIGKIHTLGNQSEESLLKLAAAAEYRQTHPLGKAILQEAQKRQLKIPEMTHIQYEVGYGVKAQMDTEVIRVGSYRFMENEKIELSAEAQKLYHDSEGEDHTFIFVAVNQILAGMIESHSTIRPETKAVIQDLKDRGLSVCIMSGDHEMPTKQLADKLGISDYYANMLPENKAKLIRSLQKENRSVCFVGDGLNDSIALKAANVSISMSGASTIAMDAANIILTENSLTQLPQLLNLTENFNQNMKNTRSSVLIPSGLGISGIFLLGFGLYSSLLLYLASMGMGLTNAMLPILGKDTPPKK
ncbi:heavy metal translocating P-type ATPase [Deltaproteobacteria bacterium TL4]